MYRSAISFFIIPSPYLSVLLINILIGVRPIQRDDSLSDRDFELNARNTMSLFLDTCHRYPSPDLYHSIFSLQEPLSAFVYHFKANHVFCYFFFFYNTFLQSFLSHLLFLYLMLYHIVKKTLEDPFWSDDRDSGPTVTNV